ncbi:MAG: AIM24 family protein [Planctomycetota bacterium]
MARHSHEVDYRIIGDEMQAVEVELDPGETVVAEAGAMNYMEDGIAFIHVGGTVMRRDLADGETLRVDTGCPAAFTRGVDYNIQQAGNLKSMFLGGEGLFLATLRGPGRVWIQSMPFTGMIERILAKMPGDHD